MKDKKVFIVEDHVFFDRSAAKLGGLRFNILKPIYHRATMRVYYDKLKSKGIDCTYVGLRKNWADVVGAYVDKHGSRVWAFDPVDRNIQKKIVDNFECNFIDTYRFILTSADMAEYVGAAKSAGRQTDRQTTFYSWMRKKYGVLMTDGKPEGGKMTFDTENRSPPHKNMADELPDEPNFSANKYILDAADYVEDYARSADRVRSASPYFIPKDFEGAMKFPEIKFPISGAQSKLWLAKFIKGHLNKFGDTQDVMLDDPDNSFIHHSGISPMLNVGLLTPRFVIKKIIEAYDKMSRQKAKNLHNVEGFIRQILGWREFCRYIYVGGPNHDSGRKNFFKSTKMLDDSWYNGTTSIDPVDVCIKKAFRFGYLHHIERLMIIANFMTISRIHPHQMYKWFMEFALDSYDWVMEFNVYSMASYSDGGEFTSKPYISSSNYVAKMSNYNRRADWLPKWDKLFWHFLKIHQAKIKKIPRMSVLVGYINKHVG